MSKHVGVLISVTNCILLIALFGNYIDNKNNFRADYSGHKYALFTEKYCEIYTILKYPRNYKGFHSALLQSITFNSPLNALDCTKLRG